MDDVESPTLQPVGELTMAHVDEVAAPARDEDDRKSENADCEMCVVQEDDPGTGQDVDICDSSDPQESENHGSDATYSAKGAEITVPNLVAMFPMSCIKGNASEQAECANNCTSDERPCKRNKDDIEEEEVKKERERNYELLVRADDLLLVPHPDAFECMTCLLNCEPGEGVILHDCIHNFCKKCLINLVEYSEEPEIGCPYRDENYECGAVLRDHEIKALLSEASYERHLAKSIRVAEGHIKNSYHCKTPNCDGWIILEGGCTQTFECPVCKANNCTNCKIIHQPGVSCAQVGQQENVTLSEKEIENMIANAVAMRCPTCTAVITKIEGCDGLKCSRCQTALCWATKQARWGPKGQGDNSGGCQCNYGGRKCHPNCNNCH